MSRRWGAIGVLLVMAAMGRAQMSGLAGNMTFVNDILEGSTAVQEVSSTYQLPTSRSSSSSWNGAGYTATSNTSISTTSWTSTRVAINTSGHATLIGNTGAIHATTTAEVGGRVTFQSLVSQDLRITYARNVSTYASPFGASVVFNGSLISPQGSLSGSQIVHVASGLFCTLTFSSYCDPDATGAANFDRTVTNSVVIETVPEPMSALALLPALAFVRRRRKS